LHGTVLLQHAESILAGVTTAFRAIKEVDQGPATTLRAHPKLNAQTTGCKALDRLQYLVGMDSIIFGWPLRVGLAPSLAAMLSQSLLQRAAASVGALRLDLAEAPTKYLNEWVSEGAVDLAIACEGPISANVYREEVLREALYLVQPAVSHEPAVGKPIEFADLTDMPLLVADPLLTRNLADSNAFRPPIPISNRPPF